MGSIELLLYTHTHTYIYKIYRLQRRGANERQSAWLCQRASIFLNSFRFFFAAAAVGSFRIDLQVPQRIMNETHVIL